MMKKSIVIFLLTLGLLPCIMCMNVYQKRGEVVINGEIIPEVIWTDASVSQCLPVYSPQTFAIVGGFGTVIVAELKGNEIVKKLENECSFKMPCKEYFSLENSPYIWGYGVRDFQFLDLNSCQANEIVVSYFGNDMIYHTSIMDSNELKIKIDIVRCGWERSDSDVVSVIYDARSGSAGEKIYDFEEKMFRLKTGESLFELFINSKPNLWKIGKKKEFATVNKLTEKLSELDITVWPKSFNPLTNFMIGTSSPVRNLVFYTIKWDDIFDNVTVEPITIQYPKDRFLSEYFEISPDGKWAKTVSNIQGDTHNDNVTFFSINSVYPQSLSLPVYGGKSSRDGGGCFVETTDWGTAYIDITPEYPGYLIVYKMRDVLAKIIEKAAAMK